MPEVSEAKAVVVRPIRGVQVVKIRGKLVLGSEPLAELRERLGELASHGEYRWVLDLQEVAMLDSSGVGVLAQLMTTSRNGHGALNGFFQTAEFGGPKEPTRIPSFGIKQDCLHNYCQITALAQAVVSEFCRDARYIV